MQSVRLWVLPKRSASDRAFSISVAWAAINQAQPIESRATMRLGLEARSRIAQLVEVLEPVPAVVWKATVARPRREDRRPRVTFDTERIRRDPYAVLAAAAATCTTLACGPRGAEPGVPALTSDSDRAVSGVVVARRSGRAAGQTVRSGNRVATTDAEGRFVLSGVPETYDLTIVSSDKVSVTVYEGLHRRDPALLQNLDDTRDASPAHTARVSGRLTSGGPYPLARQPLHVHFASQSGDADVLLGGLNPSAPRGPDFGPTTIAWSGSGAITGELMALQGIGASGEPAWFGHRTVTLRDGEDATIDLALGQVPTLQRPGASVLLDDGPYSQAIGEHFRSSASGNVFAGPGPVAAGHAYDVEDLRAFGLVTCTEAYHWDPYLRSGDVVCGAPPETAAVLRLRSGPSIISPPFGTRATPGMRFTWTAVRGAIYALELAPLGHATAQYPRIRVVTRNTSAGWPDLGDLGVRFPEPLGAYAATVTALGPYETVDDATGPEGLGVAIPKEAWWTESAQLSVPLTPALGPEEAACQYPYGAAIACSDGVYMLSAINNKLRHFPEFANAVNIHCVRDCAGARAFTEAYGRYRTAHPNFEVNEPLEALPPPPPLPSRPPPPSQVPLPSR